MYASSAGLSRGCVSGGSYSASHATSQTKPSAPVAMNAQAQPYVQRDPRHDQRRHERADVGAGIEDARGERALLLRKPLRDRLDRRREVARLAEAEQPAHQHEAGDRRRVARGRRTTGPARPPDRSAAPRRARSRRGSTARWPRRIPGASPRDRSRGRRRRSRSRTPAGRRRRCRRSRSPTSRTRAAASA